MGPRRAWLGARLMSLLLVGCTSVTPTAPPIVTPPTSSPSPSSPAAPGSPAATDSPAPPPPSSAESSPQAGLLLSEVRFAPSGDDSGFIEIINTSTGELDLRGASLSLDSAMLSLRSVASSVPPGGAVLVLLDGQVSTQGLTVHASAGFTIGPESGVVELFDRTGLRLDSVAWGDAADAVALTNGALIPVFIEPGMSIGRAPGMTASHQPLDWVVFAPAETTPGVANGLPAPAVLMPFIGGILEPAAHTLSWYPVAGAVRYRVQIQAIDGQTPEPPIEVDSESVDIDLSARSEGAYDWTVTAIDASGSESLPSAASQFEIDTALQAGILAAFVNSPGMQLPVQILSQHKDTSMLLLERNVEAGPHAWDVAHPGLDRHDPADNKNCALAAIAMANHYFGGDLSQDRIGYELFKARSEGPYQDLNYGYGTSSDRVTQLMSFALGATPTRTEPGQTADAVWAAVTASIDAGRPVVAAGSTHTIVLTGWSVVQGKRMVSYNNPWTASAGKLDIDAKEGALARELDLWVPAAGSVGRMQEPSVTSDSDGDGVVDFDEVERFHTDLNRADSDGDKVDDKHDVASSIFDPQYGYAAAEVSVGRDVDYDGAVTEVDPDSDGGGCTDGEEDANFDGHRNGSETWNFDSADDRCIRLGAYGQVTYRSETVYDPGGAYEQTTNETLTLVVRLKADPEIPGSFEDDGSSFSYRRTGTGQIPGIGSCVVVTQGTASGGGLIETLDGVIRGGLIGAEDAFSVSASIPVVDSGTIDYCVFVEPQSFDSSAQTPDSQECFGRVADVNARPRVYNFACHESAEGYSWSMSGSITVAP